ncbi:unnamed protein product [Debaryomyces tyrocola]|nr:unnamed protein product [Debaryomyces tyrocola]
MTETELGTTNGPPHRLSEPSNASGNRSHQQSNQISSHKSSTPNVFIRFIRAVFGYRKTSVTLFVFITIIVTLILVELSNSLNFSVKLPTNNLERTILDNSWLDLQKIGKEEHPYTSKGNDYVHDYLETKITELMAKSLFIEYDNDVNYTNNIIFKTENELYNQVTYYESNNLLVRINGSDSSLPALLVSAHFDSVPSSFGVTDDGMGIASLLGILNYYSSDGIDQPMRTIILNFNNNEEFGLMGATSFLHHPWFKQVRYFLNLEGTGAGGKAVLFRGTDYGIVKYFKHVRYPFGTSLFQQGFNNHLIHSETDYKIYKENGGIRGIDLAFYKPRDMYHTASDSIKNIDIKSLWHMLSNSLDFVEIVSSQRIDLDDEDTSPQSDETNREFAIFSSFFNWFFVIPVSQLVLINATCLAVIPLISLPLLVIIFNYKKNWRIGFINSIKFPVSLGLSICILNIITHNFIASINEFLPNSSYGTIVSTLYAMFLLLNYLFLNGINFIFKGYKGLYHDEKLILIIQTSFIYWVLLIVSTSKLSKNKIGNDHTGEFPLIMLFLLQSIGALFGLFSWSFKKTTHDELRNNDDEACQALLSSEEHNNYGSNEAELESQEPILSNSSVSLNSSLSQVTNNLVKNLRKSFSYDWSIQYIVIVPLSSLIVYNTGSLLLSGLNKSIQESLNAEKLIFDLIQLVAVTLAIPFLPFIFKINRLLVTALVLVLCLGFISIFLKSPFDQLNPLKLRFVQSINLDESSDISVVNVFGRYRSPMNNVLLDLPSLKETNESLECKHLQDGMQVCSYNSLLLPNLSSDVTDFNDYLDVQVLKNSSSDYRYGLLSGEIKINVPENRVCRLSFNNSNFENSKQSLVRTILVYEDNNYENSSNKLFPFEMSELQLANLPEGFSRDKKGTYIFKNLNGIDKLELNKLSWDKPYHVGFQWMPKFVDSILAENENNDVPYSTDFNNLGIQIECFWGNLGYGNNENKTEDERIPAYSEVLHYSPNYVSWANKESGLVSVLKYVEI